MNIKLADSPSPAPHGVPTDQPDVSPSMTTVPVSPSPGGDSTLPKTGADVVWLVFAALALLLVGTAMMSLLRRRRHIDA